MKNKLYLFIISVTLIYSCANLKHESGAHYDYAVRCLGVEMDGSVTLESFGKGRNYLDAVEQAKKNAVHAVIFKGIKQGNGGCNNNPLLLSASAEEVYEEYFASFFSDGGEFKDFVQLNDERISNKLRREAKKSKQIQQRIVVVRVDRLALNKKLKSDNLK